LFTGKIAKTGFWPGGDSPLRLMNLFNISNFTFIKDEFYKST